MTPNTVVQLSATVTIYSGGAGFTMRRNGSDFCGFFLWSQSTLFLAADSPIEQDQGNIVPYTFGVPFFLEAELDGTTLTIWMDGVHRFSGPQSTGSFTGTGQVGTLHHSESSSSFDTFNSE